MRARPSRRPGRFALLGPSWNYDGSVYFGCREAHLPVELGYSAALLEAAGFEAFILDGQLDSLSPSEMAGRVREIAPDFVVVTTAPSYLFWRCPPPELKSPMALMAALEGVEAKKIVIGPHGSVTPRAVLRKLRADIVVMGEPETVLPEIAASKGDLSRVFSVCYDDNGAARVQGGPRAADMSQLPALRWPARYLDLHRHHHHRFGTEASGAGAEVEASRGCPYSCTFCAKGEFRNRYRRRPLNVVLDEIDALASRGAGYVYFIDEIFMPDRAMLEALASRRLSFGIQTRIELWKPDMLEMLGAAGCVSIEAGIESISEKGRAILGKRCNATTRELMDLLAKARKSVPFVQATLMDAHVDDRAEVDSFRAALLDSGVWANRPVPMFPFPGSEEYSRRWGQPDESAWERAHEYYLDANETLGDMQDGRPVPIRELEGR